MSEWIDCPACGGSGTTPDGKDTCPVCRGSGKIHK